MKHIGLGVAVGLGLVMTAGTGLRAIALDEPLLLTDAHMNPLQGAWQLSGWGDPNNLTTPIPGSEITANFDGDRMAGSASCNRYTTPYTLDGDEINLGTIAATLMACEPDISDQEQQFLQALENIETYEITDRGELYLTYQTETDNGVLVFLPQAVPALW